MNENEIPKIRIPVFSSVAEEAAFWDSHDTAEFENEFKPVRLEVSPEARHRRNARKVSVGDPDSHWATGASGDDFAGTGVGLGFDARLSYSDVAPFLDELNARVDFVRTGRWNSEPPAAAGSEIAMTIVLGGAGAFAASFLQKLGEDAYAAVRARFLETLHRAREGNRRRGEGVTEAAIHIGDLRLYIELWNQQELTDEQLRERFAAAADIVRKLPHRAFEGGRSPSEYGLRWDEASRSWAGTILMRDGVFSVPPAGAGEPEYIPEPKSELP